MSVELAPIPRRRRLSLTPMIDVVFLLLIFFMLAAQFGGTERFELTLGGGAASYSGPPRLVEVYPVEIKLNGIAMSGEALTEALGRLSATPADTVVLRARGGATLDAVTETLSVLTAAGYSNLVLVE